MPMACGDEMSENCEILDLRAFPETELITKVSGKKSKKSSHKHSKTHKKKDNTGKTPQTHTVDINIGFPDPTSMVISMTSDVDDLNSILPTSDEKKYSPRKLEPGLLSNYYQNYIPENLPLLKSEFIPLGGKDKPQLDDRYMVGCPNEDVYLLRDKLSRKYQEFSGSELTAENISNLTSSYPEKDNNLDDKIPIQTPRFQKHNLLANCDEIISTLNDSGYSTEDWKTRFVSESPVIDDSLSATDILLESKHTFDFDWKEVAEEERFEFISKRPSEILLKNRSDLSVSNLIYYKKPFSYQSTNHNILSTNEVPLVEDPTILELPKYVRHSADVKEEAFNSTNISLGSASSHGQLNINLEGAVSIENGSQLTSKKKTQGINTDQQVYALFNVPNYSSIKRKSSILQESKTAASAKANYKGINPNKNKSSENAKLCSSVNVPHLKHYHSPKNRRCPALEANNRKNQELLNSQPVRKNPSKTPSVIKRKFGKSSDSKSCPPSRTPKDNIYAHEVAKNYGKIPRRDSSSTHYSGREIQAYILTKTETDAGWDTQSQEFATARSMISSIHTNRSVISDEDSARQLMERNGSGRYCTHFTIQQPEDTSAVDIIPLNIFPDTERDCMRKKCPRRRRCSGRNKSRGRRCLAASPDSDTEAHLDVSDKDQQDSKQKVLSSASAPNKFIIPLTQNVLFGPTIDDVVIDALCSSSIKGEECWEKLKNSLHRFRNEDRKNDKNNSCPCETGKGGDTILKESPICCQCPTNKDGELSGPLTPRLDGCTCGPSNKCQLERRKAEECICSPVQKDKPGCICGSAVRSSETKSKFGDLDRNDLDIKVPEKICNTCFYDNYVPHVRDILGPTFDDSVLSCMDFFMGGGKDKCRNKLQDKISSSLSKEAPVSSIPPCRGSRSERDLISWIQNEYKTLKEEVCPGDPLGPGTIEKRQRALNNLSELMEIKRELEHLGSKHNTEKMKQEVDCASKKPHCWKRTCPGAEYVALTNRSTGSVSAIGNNRRGGVFDSKLNDYVTPDPSNQFHVANLECKRGSLPFSPMPSLKEVISRIDHNNTKKEMSNRDICRSKFNDCNIPFPCSNSCYGARNKFRIFSNFPQADLQKYRSETCINEKVFHTLNTPWNSYKILTTNPPVKSYQVCHSFSDINLPCCSKSVRSTHSPSLCCNCRSNHDREYYASSSSEDSDECPDECACAPLRYKCSRECRAKCSYPFPGEECNDNCRGKCNDAAKSSSTDDKENIPEEYVKETFKPLAEALPVERLKDEESREMESFERLPDEDAKESESFERMKETESFISEEVVDTKKSEPSKSLMDRDTKITESFVGMNKREKSTGTDAPFLEEKFTSASNLVTKSNKITQTTGTRQIDASTSITPSYELLTKMSKPEPVRPSFDGDAILPTPIKYRKRECSPNCIKYAEPVGGRCPFLNRISSRGNYDVYRRSGDGGVASPENIPMPGMIEDSRYQQDTVLSGTGGTFIPEGVPLPDALPEGGLYPQGIRTRDAGEMGPENSLYPKDIIHRDGSRSFGPGGATLPDLPRSGNNYPQSNIYGNGSIVIPGGGPGPDFNKDIYPKMPTNNGGPLLDELNRGGPGDEISDFMRNGDIHPKSTVYGYGSLPDDINRGGPRDGRPDFRKNREIYPRGTTYSGGPTLDEIRNRSSFPKSREFGDGPVGGTSYNIPSNGGGYPKSKKNGGGKTSGSGRGTRRRIVICSPNRIYGRRSDNCNKYTCRGIDIGNRQLPPVLENVISGALYRNEYCGLHHKAETTDGEECSCQRVRSSQMPPTKRICSSKGIKNHFSLPVIKGYNTGQRWYSGLFSKSVANTRITKVLWAVTRINVFQDESKTYEVMAATEEPPRQIPRSSEGVFVVIPNKKRTF